MDKKSIKELQTLFEVASNSNRSSSLHWQATETLENLGYVMGKPNGKPGYVITSTGERVISSLIDYFKQNNLMVKVSPKLVDEDIPEDPDTNGYSDKMQF